MVHHLLADLDAAQGFGITVVLQVLSRMAALGFVLCLIGALCLRLRPVARAAGLLPRLAAVGGTFSITALALLPRFDMPPAVAGTSLMLMLLGYGLACYALGHLGRSLSIMAEARRLVTSGPYALVRHPLYAAEAVASLGVLLQFLSPAAVVLWAVHIALQCCRMRYEEQILQLTFPEYEGYARRVARLVPGVY
jgi:protein-S-isoprenylcysteine O-methyltransferase Ste14